MDTKKMQRSWLGRCLEFPGSTRKSSGQIQGSVYSAYLLSMPRFSASILRQLQSLTFSSLHEDWKTERYKEIIKSGTVEPRPGVLRLMDEAKAAGKKVAVCSAATKSSVILCLENLIGMERFQGLDCFLAGDDVKEKKPDPSIYITAAKRLNVLGKDCLVVEDSVIGLLAATGAGMSCLISYTSSTANQDFKEAAAIYPDLSDVRLTDLEALLKNVAAQ